MAKRDVAGHDVTVDPPYVVGGASNDIHCLLTIVYVVAHQGKGKKKLAAIFIDNEALEEDEDETEAGTQTVEDGPGEEGCFWGLNGVLLGMTIFLALSFHLIWVQLEP
ncbi:hypothetical protein K439DRAFT_1625538 [Ramaria rubella]|nr:hypothetical protein K439DRAFT_1625538 [Ramaria rubella]